MSPKSADYGAEQIQVLEGLEPVRKRPGMYIGSTDITGLQRLVTEIVNNAMDEALAGAASHIRVEFFTDNSVAVYDNGSGIPLDFKNRRNGQKLNDSIQIRGPAIQIEIPRSFFDFGPGFFHV